MLSVLRQTDYGRSDFFQTSDSYSAITDCQDFLSRRSKNARMLPTLFGGLDMRSVIFVLLVTCLPISVCAKPIAFWSSSRSETYADSSSIKKNGAIVQVEFIQDFKQESVAKATGKPFKSLRVEMEVNCSSGQTRAVGEKFYSDNMARGNAYQAVKLSNNWRTAEAGTFHFGAMEFACEKGAFAPLKIKGSSPFSAKVIDDACRSVIADNIRPYANCALCNDYKLVSIEALPAVKPEESGLPANRVPKTDRLYPVKMVVFV